MNKTAISVIIVGVLIGGAVVFSSMSSGGGQTGAQNANNVSVADGKQIVEIGAKGGYSPRISTAKADMPTILRMQTNGTFDCSSGVTIPSMGYRKNLPPSGITDIEIPAQKSGTVLQGLCAMGMYNFQVKFD